ncbi:MAG: Cof-type HAD-IIB family hydrolase [Clostridiales Family XIII bacterium]|jgi:Cof subfamily protein (haloacid dehalogenase superfamily)|nr:Cof-type HAD-IIB family hydrolase [Clostridiales Family XIII bacterium]
MADTSKVKGLFFDLDGTLLGEGARQIPDSALHALSRARAHGMLIFIATGRHFLSLPPSIADLQFDGYVCLNGQHCVVDGRTVFANPVPRRDAATMVMFMESSPYVCHWLGESECFTNRYDPSIRKIFDDLGIGPFTLRPPGDALEMDVLQFELFVPDDAIADQVVAEMPGCCWTRWHEAGIDVLSKGGGKWMGIEKAMSHFRLSNEEIIVFGDADNDVEMLRNAVFSVAMGNGTPAAKAAAKYLADDLENDGLQRAMAHLLPQLGL